MPITRPSPTTSKDLRRSMHKDAASSADAPRFRRERLGPNPKVVAWGRCRARSTGRHRRGLTFGGVVVVALAGFRIYVPSAGKPTLATDAQTGATGRSWVRRRATSEHVCRDASRSGFGASRRIDGRTVRGTRPRAGKRMAGRQSPAKTSILALARLPRAVAPDLGDGFTHTDHEEHHGDRTACRNDFRNTLHRRRRRR